MSSERADSFAKQSGELLTALTVVQDELARLKNARARIMLQIQTLKLDHADIIVLEMLRVHTGDNGVVGVLVPESRYADWDAAVKTSVLCLTGLTTTINFTSTSDDAPVEDDDWQIEEIDSSPPDEDDSHVLCADGETRYEWDAVILPKFWENAGRHWVRTWPDECETDDDGSLRQSRWRLIIRTKRLVLIMPKVADAVFPINDKKRERSASGSPE